MPLQPGFDFTEATAMIALSQAIYGVPAIPVPTPSPKSLGWSKVDALSPAGPTLLDNFWQVWRNDARPNQYAIVVRGTIDSKASILADLLFPLVDARLDLSIETGGFKLDFPFHLARDERGSAVVAGTHLGFSLSLFLMLLTTNRPLLATLSALALDPDAEILVTGHSQGASIATLLTSFVRHASGIFSPISNPSYKTYVFAPAKPGNDHYGYDFSAIAGAKGMGWTIVSTQGWVPQVPFTLQIPGDINTPNPLRDYAGIRNINIDPRVAALCATVEPSIEDARRQIITHAYRTADSLKEKLRTERLAFRDTLPGVPEASELNGSCLAGTIDNILSHIQLSLNFATAGALVPLFAVPGDNPDDPTDFFWQHHLGNYWTYLQAQYDLS
ncbi:lipase family protein [Stappia sp. ES.058]|uniref:lipase family protein n=1 Tax=Stappia sp. ES.058 TaxID=1881061 RepID=UPI00087DE9A2|nr:lipase family protein [Stappia sp. ES.058]SDU34111.1 Lipase (class 3) [Stappia sp. ES.058]